MSADAVRALLARHANDFARGDAAALAANYAEDCIVDSPIAGVHKGRLAVERAFKAMFSAFPNLCLHTHESLILENRAVWTGRVEGTDNGGFMGLPPTGKPFSTSAVFVLTFDNDGKIVHERRIYDFSRLVLHLAGDAEPATEGPRLYREMVERAQHEHELQIAAAIQRALMPPWAHHSADIEVAATSVPCRAIGGDFFDHFALMGGASAYVLGDVAGKGPSAALLAALLQGVFSANAHSDGTPADIVRRANTALVHRAIESRFATIVYAMLSCDGRLTYCNAGHNPPFLVGKSGVRRLETGGLIIGVFEDAVFEEQTLQLQSGDVLVAFSDGMTEAENPAGQEFGEERFLSCVIANCDREPTALLQCLLDAVAAFSIGAAQSDDRTVLVLRYSGSNRSPNGGRTLVA